MFLHDEIQRQPTEVQRILSPDMFKGVPKSEFGMEVPLDDLGFTLVEG